jgi:TolB protein
MWLGVVARLAVIAALSAGTALVVAPTAGAAYPGRDGLIAFVRTKLHKWSQIYVVRPDGSGLRRLTHRRGGAATPTWSPDGRQIAFISSAADGPGHVFVKRLGGGVRKLTHGRDQWADPTWSPDGRFIAATRLRYGSEARLAGPSS